MCTVHSSSSKTISEL